MRSCQLFTRAGWLLVGAAVLLFASGAGQSQDLKKNYDKDSTVREQLFSGDLPANPKSELHRNIAQASAEYFLLRVAQKADNPDKLQKDFTSNVNKLLDKNNVKKNMEFRKLYGPVLVGTIKSELAQDIKVDPSAVVHEAMMLPIMARLKHPYVSEYLVTLIEDNKTHDAVRLYAIKALKDTMPIETQLELYPTGIWDFTDKAQNARRKSDARSVETLTKYIERAAKTSPDDLAAFKFFLRREAIVSLAAAGTPAVYAFGKAPAKDVPLFDGLVAPTLMKVLVKGALQPEPTIQEKIEAALGLCAMDYTNMPEYQPELAVYLVGQTVVEFAREYSKDRPNFVLDKGKKPPFVAWKTEAKRFQAGLIQLKDNARGNAAAAKSAGELQNSAAKLLLQMEKYQIVERLEDFSNQVARMRPKDAKVFKTLKVPALNLP